MPGNINEEFVAGVRKILTAKRVLIAEPMKNHTTFKIGGPVDYLLFPTSLAEVQAVVRLLKDYAIPYVILGNGSNVLVLDKGVRGAIINFQEGFAGIRREGNHLLAEAGALLKDVAGFAAAEGLSGLEFAVGIPGSIGGAVFMNAGAYGGEMKDVVSAVRSVSPDGEVTRLEAEELGLGYRRSVFQENEHVICEVELSLKPGNKEDIVAQMADFTQRRENKQPLEMPSAGSTFKRPKGYYAGTLIDQTGLKGFRVGGAQVSEKHAGFVVNAGGATAADVLALIDEVQKRVYDAHGVKLYPEVRIIGSR